MNKIKLKVSATINILIFVLTIVSLIIMFTGFKFMHGVEPVLESTKIGMFKYFTVDSNLFMGIIAFVFAIKEMELLKSKIEEIPLKFYILKLMSTTAVGLTFLVVFAYLGPISKGGLPSMLQNSNLFLHLLIPVFSMITFALFERTDKLKIRYVTLSMAPTAIYAVFYLINILVHSENGKVLPTYDWYWFVQGGLWQIVIVAPMILGISYIIGLILWKFNKIKEKGE